MASSDTTPLGRVASLWRYPAKSFQGAEVDTIELDDLGVIGDRSWAVRDEVRGGIRGAKKIGALMNLAARYVDGEQPTAGHRSPPIVITLPDGSEVRSDDEDVDERLSRALEHEVTLHPLHDPGDLDHYRRGGPDTTDLERELRDIFGRTNDEPLPDLSPFAHVAEFESPPGTYVDAYPLHLVTAQTLAALAAATDGPDADVRRLRPNVVIDLDDAGGAAHPEAAWAGRTVTIGEVALDVVVPTARCAMVTRGFGDLEANRPLLRTIVRQFDQSAGVYARVLQAGTVRIGDPVTVSTMNEDR